ncbi:MAG: PQQ-binding-like beta-propeller repeat protein [Steroidobacteraceae bacterium]
MGHVIACVDAHVHLHSCYDPDELLQNAYDNLAAASNGVDRAARKAFFLLLAECRADDCFGALRALADGLAASNGASDLNLRRWAIAATEETISVVARRAQQELFIVAGRQVACREGLEVLVLGTTHRFEDGWPIREILRESEALGVPRVIPWGPGKWFFRRGRLLNELEEGMTFFPTFESLPSSEQTFYTAVRAVDAYTGKPVWEHRERERTGDSTVSGLLSTRGGLIFAAADGEFFALDARSGQTLWTVGAGGTTYAAPVTFSVGGQQFVSVVIGRSLLTFALPQTPADGTHPH